MAWFSRMARCRAVLRLLQSRWAMVRRLARRLFLGRQFSLSLDRNREAADRLDAAINELFRN